MPTPRVIPSRRSRAICSRKASQPTRSCRRCATPSTPEAVFVARIDDMDAKLSAVEEELRKAPPGAEFMPLRAIDGQLLITPPKTGA